jgi:23S rRNA (adenine2503-C2)-methyltransferase
MKINNILISNGEFPTKKYIFEKENKTVEFTYVNRPEKHIICISCMFGCPVRCIFCASGTSYNGNLNSEDMIYAVKDIINNEKISNDKKLLLSFMGSGEPLLNIEQVNQVIDYFHKFLNVYFVISTSGVNIEQALLFNNKSKIKIRLSLHNPENLERKEMIPKTEDLDKILKVLSKINNEIEINYILLEGINDSKVHAEKLATLINTFNFYLKINEYHQVKDSVKESSKKENFLRILNKNKVKYELYSTDGTDIKGACGQLVSQLTK